MTSAQQDRALGRPRPLASPSGTSRSGPTMVRSGYRLSRRTLRCTGVYERRGECGRCGSLRCPARRTRTIKDKFLRGPASLTDVARSAQERLLK